MMIDLKDRIKNEKFKLIDDTHPLEWSYNDTYPPTMLYLKSEVEPGDFIDTMGIRIQKFKQNMGTWALLFILNDSMCKDIFESFCKDVVESSRNVPKEYGPQFAYDRYIKWVYLFKPNKTNKLTKDAIQGLIGEMYALQKLFIPKYSPDSALKAWMNKSKGKQDFIQSDCWYEIKTIHEDKDTVKISSLEQLDRDDYGLLIVIKLRKTSTESPNKITINSLYSNILEALPTFYLKKRFTEIMSNAGYSFETEYDEICFEIKSLNWYEVKDDFPRLTPSNLPNQGISSATYEILLDSISSFEVDGWKN